MPLVMPSGRADYVNTLMETKDAPNMARKVRGSGLLIARRFHRLTRSEIESEYKSAGGRRRTPKRGGPLALAASPVKHAEAQKQRYGKDGLVAETQF